MSKAPRYIGFGLGLTECDSIAFHLNPTTNGVSFGPVIAGHDIHVTAFEKNGMFHSHLTYSEKGWKKPKYEPITTMPRDEMATFLRNEGVEPISLLLEKYGETDEALVLTDEGKKVFRELLKGSLTIDVRGRKLLFEISFGHLVNKEKVLEEKVNRFFKVGTVAEAIENDLFGKGPVLSPELKPILTIGDETYIYRRSPLETFRSLKSSAASIEDFFKELEKTELRLVSKYSEIFGMRQLFTELERRNLLEKWFPRCASLT